jgi:hypothetical protein
MQTTASDLAALDAALARDALAQARAERQLQRADGPAQDHAARFERAAAAVGEALL